MLIRQLKGIGEKTEQLFNKVGVTTVEELLMYYPRNYDEYKRAIMVQEIDENIVAIEGTIIKNSGSRKMRGLEVLSIIAKDTDGSVFTVTWFNMGFLKNVMKIGYKYVFRGRVSYKGNTIALEQPEYYSLGDYDRKISELQPIYPLTDGLTNNAVIKAVKQALTFKHIINDELPIEIKDRYGLPDLETAITGMHFPKNKQEMYEARKRIAFDEFLRFIISLRKMKENTGIIFNDFKIGYEDKINEIIKALPFTLTNAQIKVIDEIQKDMTSHKVMSRLVQGDVGSGKTIIAFLALFQVSLSGYQGCLMAPTEVLAKQHFIAINELLLLLKENGIETDIKVELLTGSTTAKEKKRIYELVSCGEVDILIGTHALIQEKVEYKNLALVITDEQHRFGVNQREMLSNKGKHPHVLVMSATPIPRTLAIIIYGDLDISIIDELPANRLPIKNCVVDTSFRANAYKFIEEQVKLGHQAYVICPMVEESENLEAENVMDYASNLKKTFSSSVNVEFLHGKMKADDKNNIMERFSRNEIQVLVSTTVIEVGINVPNSTVMLIENAERFGLAGLHQLRGRVGRGDAQSYCIFISSSKNKDKIERLNILKESNDGFKIASEDLKLRGPGDFFGIRQSGEMNFKVADIYDDSNMLKAASETADRIFAGEIQLPDCITCKTQYIII